MRHPPYHLRLNKAIDRYLLIEALSIVGKKRDLGQYRYYGLGGPFLEDFRLLSQHFHDLRLTSLEASAHTLRRQRFHLCAKSLELLGQTVESFLTTYSGDAPCVFWLDYTDLRPERIQEFEALLDRVAEGSVVKLTLKASLDNLPGMASSPLPAQSDEEVDEQWRRYMGGFKEKFDAVLPSVIESSQLRAGNFPVLLQRMLQIASQRALPPSCGRRFQILHSCFYSDHTQMYSLTGVVCREEELKEYRRMFARWPPRNLRWRQPDRIDVPVLSLKERMFLERYLPARKATGKALRKALGYNIDDTAPATLRQLKQYADFYRYYPHFAKVTIV